MKANLEIIEGKWTFNKKNICECTTIEELKMIDLMFKKLKSDCYKKLKSEV